MSAVGDFSVLFRLSTWFRRFDEGVVYCHDIPLEFEISFAIYGLRPHRVWIESIMIRLRTLTAGGTHTTIWSIIFDVDTVQVLEIKIWYKVQYITIYICIYISFTPLKWWNHGMIQFVITKNNIYTRVVILRSWLLLEGSVYGKWSDRLLNGDLHTLLTKN